MLVQLGVDERLNDEGLRGDRRRDRVRARQAYCRPLVCSFMSRRVKRSDRTVLGSPCLPAQDLEQISDKDEDWIYTQWVRPRVHEVQLAGLHGHVREQDLRDLGV